jgi:hypothetical protein
MLRSPDGTATDPNTSINNWTLIDHGADLRHAAGPRRQHSTTAWTVAICRVAGVWPEGCARRDCRQRKVR